MHKSFSMRSPRVQKAAVCLFFALTLAVGLFTVADYGRPWDESDEMDILRMNLWEYARTFGLDESLFTRWAAEERVTISPLTPISESIEQDHGIAAFYPLAGPMLDLRLTEHSRMLLWHGYCWLLFTLGCAALYACCRELGLSRGASLLGALFLLFSPRFFAEGHYNNKDVVLLSLSLCVLWQGLRLMKKPSVSRAVLFALAGAFAANTKVAGAALWGLCALFVLLRQLLYRRFNRRTAWLGGLTLLSFLIFYVLLTPALWASPSEFLSYLLGNALAFGRWENYVRFRGVTFLLANERLPWYYLPYMMLATTPLWALLFIAVGQGAALRRCFGRPQALGWNDHMLGLLLCTLLWLLPLSFALLTRTTVYNGWRHFYFLYGFLLILAAYGASALLGCLKRRPRLKAFFCALLGLALAFTGAGLVTQHPYQFAYYQPAVRLLSQPDDLEMDYWNLSVMDALTEIAKQNEGVLSIGYGDLWAEAGLRRTLPALSPQLQARFRLCEEPQAADYVLENPTYALFSGFAPEEGQSLALEIASYGSPIMRVYQNDRSLSEEKQP